VATLLVRTVLATRRSSSRTNESSPASPGTTSTAHQANTPASFAVGAADGSTLVLPPGRPALLFFMTSQGCDSCIAEAGALDAVKQDAGERVAMVGIELAPDATLSYLRTLALTKAGYP
jgi:hypothetical protein